MSNWLPVQACDPAGTREPNEACDPAGTREPSRRLAMDDPASGQTAGASFDAPVANRRLQLVYGRQEGDIAAPIRSLRETRQSAFPVASGSRFAPNRFTQNSKALAGSASTPGHAMGPTGGGFLGSEGLGGTLGNGLALVQLTLHPSFLLKSCSEAPRHDQVPMEVQTKVNMEPTSSGSGPENYP